MLSLPYDFSQGRGICVISTLLDVHFIVNVLLPGKIIKFHRLSHENKPSSLIGIISTIWSSVKGKYHHGLNLRTSCPLQMSGEDPGLPKRDGWVGGWRGWVMGWGLRVYQLLMRCAFKRAQHVSLFTHSLQLVPGR